MHVLHSRKALFDEKEAFTSIPHGAGPAAAKAEQCHTRGVCSWICWREWRRVSPYLLPHPSAHSAFTSPRRVDSALHLASSEEVDTEGARDPPPQSPQYEELLEGMTRAVAKLKIDWPAEERAELQTSRFDERFLRGKAITSEHGACRSSLISTLRCQDRGQDPFRPASSSPPPITTQLHRRLVYFSSIRADGSSTSRCCSRSHGSAGAKTKRQEKCAFSSSGNHLSGRGVGFDHDASTYVTCSDRVDPHCSRKSEGRPVTHCKAVSETAGSDGSCIQRDTSWPAVHETPTVVAQDQGGFAC